MLRNEYLPRYNPAVSGEDVRADAAVSQNKIALLKLLVMELQLALDSLSEVETPINRGFDFYNEVTRFEIELIRQALIFTGGHQGKAARLLQLKATTLNSKINHYHTQLRHPASPAPRRQNDGED